MYPKSEGHSRTEKTDSTCTVAARARDRARGGTLTLFSRRFPRFGAVLADGALCSHKMAGPRLGVSPIACQPPSRCARNPPQTSKGFHSRFSASLRRTFSISWARAVTSRPDAHWKNYGDADYSFRRRALDDAPPTKTTTGVEPPYPHSPHGEYTTVHTSCHCRYYFS